MKIAFGRPENHRGDPITEAEFVQACQDALARGERLESPSVEILSGEAMALFELIGAQVVHNPQLIPVVSPGETMYDVMVSAWMGDRRLTDKFYFFRVEWPQEES